MQVTSLVPRLLNGDGDAVGDLIDATFAPLCGIARRRGASPQDAEDIAMDAIVETLRLLPTLNFEGSGNDPLFGYLAKAAALGVIEQFRQKEREHATIEKVVGQSTIPRSSRNVSNESKEKPLWSSSFTLRTSAPPEDLQLLLELMNQLSEQDRLLVDLRSHTTLTWEEIGEDVGLSAVTARKRWQRICEKFAERFEVRDRKGVRDV